MTKNERLEILEGLKLEDTSEIEEAILHILIDMNQPEKSKSCKNHPLDLAEMMEYCKKHLEWPITREAAKSIWQYYCPPGGDDLWRDKKNVLVKDWRRRMVTCKKNDNGGSINGTKNDQSSSRSPASSFGDQRSQYGQELLEDV